MTALPISSRLKPFSVVRFAVLAIFAAVITLAFARWSKANLFEIYQVPSRSMLPLFRPGDLVLVKKFKVSANQGQVVVFPHPSTKELFIKRVAAGPGDEILILGRSVWVNGQALAQAETDHPNVRTEDNHFIETSRIDQAWPKSGVWRVPADHFFALGDYRDESSDSRSWGFVRVDAVIGEAACRARGARLTCDLR